MFNSVLVKRQVKQLVKSDVIVDGQKYKKVVCNVRYDDQCGNGHNTFAITGEFYLNLREISRDEPSMYGCCHNELSKVFPEIAHLIKWHLVSSDGPMHYIANTTYHARTCDTEGAKVGDPIKWDEFILLGNSEYPHEFSSKFMAFLKEAKKHGWILKQKAVPHKGDSSYNFSEKYTIEGFDCDWCYCPFDSLLEVEGFCNTVSKHGFSIIEKPVKRAQAVIPNLEHARNAAKWPDATLDQLSDKDALKARLPALMDEFKKDIEVFGFTF